MTADEWFSNGAARFPQGPGVVDDSAETDGLSFPFMDAADEPERHLLMPTAEFFA
jgi:hypothetical protein